MTYKQDSVFDLFPEAKPIWADAPQRLNRYVWLYPDKPISPAGELTLHIASTVPYRIFVNGRLHSWGPWRGTNKLLFVTEHKIRPENGKLELAVLAHHTARPSAEMDMTAPYLILEGKDSDGKIIVASNASWQTEDASAWEEDTLGSWFLRDMAEIFTAAKNGFQPAPERSGNSSPACVLSEIATCGKQAKTEPGSPPMGRLISPVCNRILHLDKLPRYPAEKLKDYARKVWERHQSSLGVWYHDYLNSLESTSPSFRPLDTSAMNFEDKGNPWQEGAVSHPDKKNTPQAVLFDFQQQLSGFIKIHVKCEKACTIEFAYGYSCASKEPVKEAYNTICDFGSVSFQPGETTWISFRSYGLSYIVLATEDTSALTELEVGIISTADSFRSAVTEKHDITDLLEHGLELCRRTLEICSSDSLFDCPTRERAQWLFDGMMSAQVIADLFDNPGPIRRLTHSIVSCSLPGKFLKAVIPSDFLDEIPVSEPLLIEGICHYAMRCEPQADWLIPFLKERVGTFAQFMTPDGLLDELPGRLFMDWTHEAALPPLLAEKEYDLDSLTTRPGCPYDFRMPRTLGMNATINANWLRALNAIKKASTVLGDNDYADSIGELESKAKAAYIERFFDKENALITERLPKLDPAEFPPSELPCYAALAAGLLDDDTAQKIIATCLDPDKLMIRIGSPAGSRYPIEGLIRYGRADLAKKYASIAFGEMIRADDMLWEKFTGGNPSHAWGALSLYLAWKGAICL